MTVSNANMPNQATKRGVTFKQNTTTRLTNTRQFDLLDRLTSTLSTPAGAGEQAFAANYAYNILSKRMT